MRPKIYIFAILISIFLTNVINAQILYHQTFPISNKGFWVNQQNILQKDTSNVNWTLDISACKLEDKNDYIKTVSTSGGRLEANDCNGIAIWRTPWFDITDFNALKATVITSETGSSNSNTQKYIKVYYKTSPHDIHPLSEYYQVSGNWKKATITGNLPQSESIQLQIEMCNYYAGDKVILNEVILENGDIDEPEPQQPLANNSILINEILYNPFSGGVEFVELINNGEHPVDLSQLYLVKIKSTQQEKDPIAISPTRKLLHEGDIIALTPDVEILELQYPNACPSNFFKPEKFPQLNNAGAYLAILDANRDTIDKVSYTPSSHNPLISDSKGISLERNLSNNKPAWFSCTEENGWATPGCPNSNIPDSDREIHWKVSPEVFSPNSDGYNDMVQLNYELPQPGYVATIKVFNKNGSEITTLSNNQLLGTQGTISWNGSNKRGGTVESGIYIFLIELYNNTGQRKQFKKTCVLTRRTS
ncbi:hypothetical protein EYV94_19660 [Puteibacter caeruleilacunae]|nr:hypothetical protein EYV94_19660 [Puteibacter caeruleilacunae]